MRGQSYISLLVKLFFLPVLFSSNVCNALDATKSTYKLTYHASPSRSSLQDFKSVEESSRSMSATILQSFAPVVAKEHGDAIEDNSRIHCHELPNTNICYLYMSLEHDGLLIRSSITYTSTTNDIDADVLIAFDNSRDTELQPVVQEALISLATKFFQDVFADLHATWIIHPVAGPLTVDKGTTGASQDSTLMNMILSKPINQITNKRRLYSSLNLTKHDIQVWQYTTATGTIPRDATNIFINQILRFTSAAASAIHAEALVHPALINHVSPKRVLVVSDMPFAILDELYKYNTSLVERIDVVGTSAEIRQVMNTHFNRTEEDRMRIPVRFLQDEGILTMEDSGDDEDDDEDDDEPVHTFVDIRETESNDYTKVDKERLRWLRNICYDEEVARANKKAGRDWERLAYCGKHTLHLEDDTDDSGDDTAAASDTSSEDGSLYDVILVDIPSYMTSEWLSLHLQYKLKDLLDEQEGMLVISVGAPPDVNDFLDADSSTRHAEEESTTPRVTFLRQATRRTRYHGIGYEYAAVYDEVSST